MSYWNLKIYSDGEERETIRGLKEIHVDALMNAFAREGVHAQAMKWSGDGKSMLDSTTVNRPTRGGLL